MTAAEARPALSMQQPWASLIVSGRKTIELREWPTPYRGLLWIHAGKSASAELLERFGLGTAFRGGFVGAATLAACIRMDESRWRQWESRHLAGGQIPDSPEVWAWLMTGAVRFREPIPSRGQLKLFTPPIDVQRQLETALREAGGELLIGG